MAKINAYKAYWVALASAVFLSTTAIFIRFLTTNYAMPVLVLAFWRDFFVVLTLLPIMAIKVPRLVRIQHKDLHFLLIFGFLLAIFNSFWTISVALNGAAVATVLCYCSAAFTAILGKWLLKEDLGWVKIIAIVCSLLGCVLVAGAYDRTAWQTNLTGILSGVLSGLAYAAYSLMGRSASQRGLNPWTTLLYTFGFAAVILLVLNMIPGFNLIGKAVIPHDLFWLGTDLKGWIVLFLLAAIPTVMGFGLYNVSLQYLPASVVNLIATSEPVFTTILAYLIFHEKFEMAQWLGSILVMTGVILLRLERKERRKDLASSK
ncbi:MAG TPA: EamA family transporter [Anaerolineaceae bacterium]|nr:EamA family transporter [Anaerolineaceae bacterium]